MILLSIIVISLSFQFLNGCVEQDLGKVSIIGKGSFNSIQDAINSASDGDIIKVSAGQYDEILIVDKSIELIGESANSTILNYSDNETEMSIITLKSDNSIIKGFTIISDNISLKTNGIKIISSNNSITDNIIQKNGYGILLQNSENSMISDNIFIENRVGLLSVNSINNNILLNNFTQNTEYGVYTQSKSDNNAIKLNVFLDNYNGVRIKGSKHNRIEQNIIESNDIRGVYLCCGATNNIVFNNSIINNGLNADDKYDNLWYFNKTGNYWGDYITKYPTSTDFDNDGIWDTPYTIYENTRDLYPLVNYIK